MKTRGKKKKRRDGEGAAISRDELWDIHGACKSMRPRPGQEAYSLMCSVAACLTVWPRVTAVKAAEVRQRFSALSRNGYAPAGAAHPVSPRSNTPPVSQGLVSTGAEAVKKFVAGLADLSDDTPVLVVPGGAPTGLTLGELRRIR